jgi:mono/diheme cytochrome c family protein
MSSDVRVACGLLAVLAVAGGPICAADEVSVQLAAGDGLERVKSACAVCHSLDYIVMNSPFLDASGWEKTVTKMINVMGAPITTEDSAIIVRYLAAHYGSDSGPGTE